MSGQADLDGRMALDRMLEAALRHEADLIGLRQPSLEEALVRLAPRLRARREPPGARPVIVLAWVTLLLVGLAVAAIVGMRLLEQRQEIQPHRLGLGVPCAVNIDPGVLLEISQLHGPGSRTATYFESGSVTEVGIGNLGLTSANRPRGLAVANSSWFAGTLTPDGLAMVRARLDALDLVAGCHRVRLPASGGQPGSFVARTPSGPVQLTWSAEVGDQGVAPLFNRRIAGELRTFHSDLGFPRISLPAETWEQQPEYVGGGFVVHTTVVPTDYQPTDVVEYPGVPAASATDGRYAAVEIPGDVTLEQLGAPMSIGDASGRGATQRCALVTFAEAGALARSLDEVAIGVDGEPDLYTPDMARAVSVELYPARAIDTCAAFEARLRRSLEPMPPPSDAVTGNLAGVDPCTIVPADRRGRIDDIGYRWATPPMGLAGARSCVLESHAALGVWSKRVTLWLYPSSITEASAATLAAALFGDGLVATEIDGRPGWLNHCVTTEDRCTGAAATWIDGKFLLLEVYDAAQAANKGEIPRDLLATIAARADAP